MSSRMWSWRKLAALFVAVAATGFLTTVLYFGSVLIAPVPRPAGPIPAFGPFKAVSFASESGSMLHGWFARSPNRVGGVVLLHGVRASRNDMLSRARFLYEAGYSVLLFDFQAHGESQGDRITFGWLEALDARAATRFLRNEIPNEPVAALGSSLGGAACVLGAEPIDVDALVLEAVYADVRQAVENRLRIRFGVAGKWLAPLLTLQMRPRMGINAGALRPVEEISRIDTPVLIISGEHDQRTTVEDTQQLFAAALEPKQFWIVPGARHVDLHQYSKTEYERRVLEFLQVYLRRTG